MDEKSKRLAGHRPTYVVAVSGGVDSVVLLHILARRLPAERLVVAHFDHGMRQDSAVDRQFVGQLAKAYGLRYVFDEGRLGPDVSEAAAREARYRFLRQARQVHAAEYIVTAHHEDDLLETAILNMLRGTGRKGLSALRSRDDLYRPLLDTPKAHLVGYARRYKLPWREDSTNSNPDYLRNYVRLNIMTRLDAAARATLRQHIVTMQHLNGQIDRLLAEQLDGRATLLATGRGGSLDRMWFIMLPHAVAREVMAAWLCRLGVDGYDRRLLERLVVAAKTLAPGKQADIDRQYLLRINRDELIAEVRTNRVR